MSREDYPGEQYPLGCVGWCFAMSRDVMNELYYMALDTPLIHLEDVSTTGILREKIGKRVESKCFTYETNKSEDNVRPDDYTRGRLEPREEESVEHY